MNTTILQIPVNKQVRDQAASVAEKMGFSSLQEVVRLFLNKMAAEEIGVRFEGTIRLSPEAVKRYNKMIDEIDSGKVKLKGYSDVDEMIRDLDK